MNVDSTAEIFVGREKELDMADRLLSPTISSWILNIYGEAGIGKTKLLIRIAERWKQVGILTSGLIDFYDSANHNEMGLLTVISKQLGESYFLEFLDARDQYYRAAAEERLAYLNKAFADFLKCCKRLSSRQSFALFLDTFEIIKDRQIGLWVVTELLPRLAPHNIKVIIAGRHRLDGYRRDEIQDIKLKSFSFQESLELAQQRFEKREITYDVNPADLEKIHGLAGGKPLLVNLAVDWLLERASPEELTAVSRQEDFEQALVLWIRKLATAETKGILYMAVVDKRFDADIISFLMDLPGPESEVLFNELQRFSFVKYRPLSKSCQLHDEMTAMVNAHVGLPPKDQEEVRSRIVEYYVGRIADAKSEAERQTLTLEKLYYELAVSVERGLDSVLSEFDRAVDAAQIDYCRVLLELVRTLPLHPDQQDSVDLAQANLLLAQYRPSEAIPVFERLQTHFDIREDEVKLVRALRGKGEAERLQGNMLAAVDALERCLDISQSIDDVDEVARAKSLLGDTFFAMGLYAQITQQLEELTRIEATRSTKVAADAWEVLANVYRRQARFDDAMQAAKRSLELREQLGYHRDIGRSYALLGLMYRDKRQWQESDECFGRAVEILEAEKDYLGLARAYSDWGWLDFVRKDLDEETKLATGQEKVEKGIAISQEYGFHWELAGDFHCLFHIVQARLGSDPAEEYLQQTCRYARDYHDGFMLFDGLFHCAEYARLRGQYEEIDSLIAELESYEGQGYRLPYFRARILYVKGHAALDQGLVSEAFKCFGEATYYHALQPEGSAGVFRFEQGLQEVKKALDGLPNNQRVQCCGEMIAYWKSIAEASELPSGLNQIVALCSDYGWEDS